MIDRLATGVVCWAPTVDIVYSAYQAENTDVLARILRLYARPTDSILDMTYNKGTFWRRVNLNGRELVTNDLYHPSARYHRDLRDTGFPSQRFDVVVLDPPYAVKKAGRLKSSFRPKDGNRGAGYGVFGSHENSAMSDDENMNLYLAGFKEAHRVLRPRGVLITKVQDGGSTARFWKMPRLVFIDGFVCEDMFVVIQKGLPPWDPKWKRQQHARKNHSYFMVHRKRG